MNEKVKEFLEAQKNDERARYEKEKQETQIRLVQCDKENPIEFSDEEYQEIEKYASASDPENTVALVLKVLAWIIFIVGFFAGVSLANIEVTEGYYYTHTETQFSFSVALTYWSSAFVIGMLFIGFSEVIKLLHEIRNNIGSR